MKITILTLFPEMFDGFLNTSIIKKAQLQNYVTIELVNIRDFSDNKWNRVDFPPIGGGAGMVMQVTPIVAALESIANGHKLLLSPRGTTFNQQKALSLSKEKHLIFICGHYEGVDERVSNFVDEELSLGDFIMTGGELAAMSMSDAVIRLIDGVINEQSLEHETFDANLLEYPQYTEPFVFRGLKVPQILYSGNHEAIRKWRLKQSLLLTKQKRLDLFSKYKLTKESETLLEEAQSNEVSKWEQDAIEKGVKFTRERK